MNVGPLAKKLQIKSSYKVLLLNSPESYIDSLNPLPQNTTVEFIPEGTYDFVQLFVKNSSELHSDLEKLWPHLRPETVFWITYPKKSSGIPSDLGTMQSWEETARYELKGVASAAIDQTWTALRFRPADQVKKSASANGEISQNNSYSRYIDIQNRVIALPEEVKNMLEKNPNASNFFNDLSFTNKKEYVIWILSAKQEQTRKNRLSKMFEMLLNGKKNPAAK